MSRMIMLPKNKTSDGTATMINELISDGEKSICFKHIRDLTHPCNSVISGELEFPATSVSSCAEILMLLEPSIKTIGIENFEKFQYEDIVKFLKKLIRKDYKIIMTGKNIIIDKFTT